MNVFLGVVVFLLGLCIGSFLNVCIYRIPEGRSIVYPSSSCPGCGAKLTALDLVPVFSYIFLKGKCRGCGMKISPRYPLVELLTALVFLSIFLKYSVSVEFIMFSFLMSVLIAVFFIDIDHRIIPDELVITGLAGGAAVIVVNLFHEISIYGDRLWWNPIAGILPGSGLLFLIALLGLVIYKTDEAMGMGDVKVFAPIGIFLGWRLCTLALLLSVIAGGLSGIILIIAGRKKRKDTLPFGPFIVAGTYVTLMWGWDIIRWYFGVG